jgi:uncharacterized peroxidase-related enzyme
MKATPERPVPTDEKRPGADTGLRLPVVSESSATQETKALYEAIRDHFGLGFVPDVFQLPSTRPSYLRVFWAGYRSIFTEGVLARERKELIAAVVARDAGCTYCVDAHVLFLEMIGASPDVIAAARSAVDGGLADANDRELLALVHRIDTEAYKINDGDLDRLRELGWSDDELVEAVWTACLFNFIVRLADSFGLYRLGQLVEPG